MSLSNTFTTSDGHSDTIINQTKKDIYNSPRNHHFKNHFESTIVNVSNSMINLFKLTFERFAKDHRVATISKNTILHFYDTFINHSDEF